MAVGADGRSVNTETFYMAMAVKEDKNWEVLWITESALRWG